MPLPHITACCVLWVLLDGQQVLCSCATLSPGEARARRESSCSPHNVHCPQHFSSSVPLHKHQITTFFAAFRLHTRPAILMQHMHVPISQWVLSQPLSSCTPLTTRSARTHCTVPALGHCPHKHCCPLLPRLWLLVSVTHSTRPLKRPLSPEGDCGDH